MDVVEMAVKKGTSVAARRGEFGSEKGSQWEKGKSGCFSEILIGRSRSF
jgi:hypothetical protein